MGLINSGTEGWLPNFSIVADDKNITEVVRKNLINLSLTDYGGSSKQSDQVLVSVVSETLKVPSHGVKIQFGMGFGTALVNKGVFVVDSTHSGGEPRIVEFTAKAAPMNSLKNAGSVQSQKTRSWSGMTIGDIVAKIATEQGLTARVAAKYATHVIEQLDQVGESDASLLTRLAVRVDAISKVSGGYWIFLPRGSGETVSGKPMKHIIITRSMVSNWSYSSNSRTASSGAASTGDGDSSGGSGTFVVQYHDKATGAISEVRSGTGNPVIYAAFVESSLSAAQELMPGVSGSSSKKLVKMDVTLLATPDLVSLTAECKVTTKGFGSVEDRDWTIAQLGMTLGEQGYTIKIQME